MTETCPHGHASSEMFVNSAGYRACRVCARDSCRRYEATRRHPLSGTWRDIKTRCYNPRSPTYQYYGARGVRMCDRWRESFADFLADVGPRPTPMHSLDRIDNDKGYEPGNVRWATADQQRRNQRQAPKLSEVAALCIRELRSRGATFHVLGDAFGVTKQTVMAVCQGRIWRLP